MRELGSSLDVVLLLFPALILQLAQLLQLANQLGTVFLSYVDRRIQIVIVEAWFEQLSEFELVWNTYQVNRYP